MTAPSPPLALTEFNVAPAADAIDTMMACCASRRFAQLMSDGRPYPSTTAALAAVDAAFAGLTWDDVLEAMAGHPRIGDQASGASAAEQAGVTDDSRAALAVGNALYEQRFGHVFLIRAAGLSGEQVLAALRDRLDNDDQAERGVATAELRAITRLRVERALG